jgi:hypothetical protein
MTDRVRAISEEQNFSNLSEQRQIAVKLYLDTVDGKIEDLQGRTMKSPRNEDKQ